MQTPLNATAVTAGNLFSNSLFEIPQYQREYSWQEEEVQSFWDDISQSIDKGTYFLGLIILTEQEQRKYVVDGQQRLITLSLLSAALLYEAKGKGRTALADKIQANFLSSIDYETDDILPRIKLTDPIDDNTLQYIIEHGDVPTNIHDNKSVSARIANSFKLLRKNLSIFLKPDPFKKLGAIMRFMSEDLYFAVFTHPNAGEAYNVFEVINTRGRGLTTADLLKNYILSQAKPADRNDIYKRWQDMAMLFSPEGSANTFVQFIRHTVTIHKGHILPKDLYNFLADRTDSHSKRAPAPLELVGWLERKIELYMQMVDQTRLGPATSEELRIFDALNSLNILTMRPILLALFELDDRIEAMRFILQLVVRRIVVGQLGTGNIERRFSEAAYKINETKDWRFMKKDMADLIPSKDDFIDRLHKRSLKKRTLAFMRRSILTNNITPDQIGHLHFIWIEGVKGWAGFEDEASFWGGTIGNTFLSEDKQRNPLAVNWVGVRDSMLPMSVKIENKSSFEKLENWNSSSVTKIGEELAIKGGEIWYGV